MVQEAKLIGQAVANAQEGVLKSLSLLSPKMSEKKFASELELLMREQGASGIWYPTLVRFTTKERPNRTYWAGRKFPASRSVFWEENSVVFIDVHPVVKGMWGDFAITLYRGNNPSIKRLIKDSFVLCCVIISFFG